MFSVPIKKKQKTGKWGKQIKKENLLLAQDLWQSHYQILLKEFIKTCKYGHDNEKCETCGIKYKYCESCFEYIEYTNVKDYVRVCKCSFL